MILTMRMWRLALVACCPLAVLAGSALASAPGGFRHGPTAWRASEPNSSGAPSAVVRQSPFGLSIEYPLLERALGAGPCPSPALIATMRELGSPPLRIGGDSQDLAGPSRAYHYFVPPSFWRTLGCLARATGGQVIVGLNFGDGTVADERATIAAARKAIPASQLSFSLGNEPDRYGMRHVLHNEPGYTVPALRSPATWSAAAYARQWRERRELLGPIRLEGPDLAGDTWKAEVGRLLREDPPDQIDAHLYPTSGCNVGPAATAAHLLSWHAAVGTVNERGWLLAAARAVHRPAVISESNSASCGGKPGLSDSPVASVWAVRFVLAALLAGFEEVRFHSAGTSYDPFVFEADGTLTRRPLASALFFLHRWVPVGSRVSSTTPAQGVFAVTIADGHTTSLIVSSFASGPLELPVAVEGPSDQVTTDTLTTTSPVDVQASVPVLDHAVALELDPDTVVALRTR